MNDTDLRDQLRRYAAVIEEHSEVSAASPSGRSRRPLALATAGVAVLALLVLAGALVTSPPGGQQVASGPRSSTPDATAADDRALLASLPRLHLPVPPDELRVTGLDTLPTSGAGPASDLDFQLFGTPGGADPFAQGDLGLFVSDLGQFVSEGGTDELPEGEDVSLGDLPARLNEDNRSFGGATLTWLEDDKVVRLVSRSLGADALVAVGRGGIDLTDRGLRLGEPPPGLELVADGRQSYSALLGFIVPLNSTGYVVDYDVDDATSNGVSVFSVADDGDLLDLIRWRDQDWLRTTEVRGHEAVLVDRHDDGNQQLVAWMEADGVVGMLSADFMTGDELLPLAEQVRPATDQEWDELEVAASTPPAPRPGEEVVLSKGLPGSGWWRLYLEPDPQRSKDAPRGWQLEYRFGTQGGGSASGRTDDLTGDAISLLTTFSDGSGPQPATFVMGLARPDVTRVLLALGDGSTVEADLSGVTSTGTRFYVAVLIDSGDPLEVAAFDDNGEAVGRVQIPGQATETETETEGAPGVAEETETEGEG